MRRGFGLQGAAVAVATFGVGHVLHGLGLLQQQRQACRRRGLRRGRDQALLRVQCLQIVLHRAAEAFRALRERLESGGTPDLDEAGLDLACERQGSKRKAHDHGRSALSPTKHVQIPFWKAGWSTQRLRKLMLVGGPTI